MGGRCVWVAEVLFADFAMGGIYGKLMDASGATKRIAFFLPKTFGKTKDKKFGIAMFLPVMYLIFTYVGYMVF